MFIVDHQHSLDYIRVVFERIGSGLDKSVTAYHIGGNAMCWHGLKNTTKDADVVFLTNGEASAFRKAVLASGFIENVIVNLDGAYADMNAFAIFDEIKETPLKEKFYPGIRLDVFVERVCGGFVYGPGMQKRCVKGFISGKMVNMISSPEDVFLFKSVTSRERDLDDMHSLYQKGLDFSVVEEELSAQLSGKGKKAGKEYASIVLDRWRLFSERFGSSVPISRKSIEK
jgi:hypothetical protein